MFEGLVGGDNGRCLLVALGDELEEELGGLFGKGKISELVDDDQFHTRELIEEALRRPETSAAASCCVSCSAVEKRTRLRAFVALMPSAMARWVFPNARGGQLSPDGVQYLLAKHDAKARKLCPSLEEKHVSPHVLRHTAAMELLQSGVDHAVIALWLGHESAETTNIYLQASMALKEKALAKTKPPSVQPGRYQPQDRLMQFLTNL